MARHQPGPPAPAPAPATNGVRFLALCAALAALGLVFAFVVRPWYLGWGASGFEQIMPLPGDDILSAGATQETRAITIHAPAASVWPWLAQLGQDRGGFYSYDLLENLVGCEMPTVDTLRPARQSWAVGDKLWMYPSTRAGGAGFATLRVYVPGWAMAFATHAVGTAPAAPDDGSWAFALENLTDSTSRLLVRGRGAAGRSLLGAAFDKSIFEPMHFTMEKRMLIGIRQLAEGRSRGRTGNHVQVLLWVLSFAMFIVGAVSVFRRAAWKRALAATVAAAVVFQVLTFGQPPLDVGVLLVSMVAVLLWWPVQPGSPLSSTLESARAA
jgi:hypothetical protein